LRQDREKEAREAQALIKIGLVVLERLLMKRQVDKTTTAPLEQGLFERTGGKDNRELVLIIANYMLAPHDSGLKLLATRTLTLLYAVAKEWNRRIPSLIGYLGQEKASQLVKSLVTSLQEVTESEDLQVAIFEFIASTLETQVVLLPFYPCPSNH